MMQEHGVKISMDEKGGFKTTSLWSGYGGR